MDQHTTTVRVPVHPEHAEARYALTAAGHAALTQAGAPPPAVVLCCTDCDHVYEPTLEDLAAGRAGCPDPDCGGWTFSSALTVPPSSGGCPVNAPEMTGPQHYREAERLLAEVGKASDAWGDAAEYVRQQLAAAQVHATLALAAATAYPAVRDYWGEPDPNTSREWAGVAS